MKNYENKHVLVIGLARSGMAAIKVLNRLGAKITLSELKQPKEEDLNYLNSIGVEIVNQDMEVFERDYDLVVKNPGVPPISPIVKKLEERHIPIITEIELAYDVSKPQHYVAITGTNGKASLADICGIVGTAHSGFQNSEITAFQLKHNQCHGNRTFKFGRIRVINPER